MQRTRPVAALALIASTVGAVALSACNGESGPAGFAKVGGTTQVVVYDRVPSDGSTVEVVVRSTDGGDLWCDSTQPISTDQPLYSVACNGSVTDQQFLYLRPVRGLAVGSVLTCTMSDGTATGGEVIASSIPGVSYEVVTADQSDTDTVTSCTV